MSLSKAPAQAFFWQDCACHGPCQHGQRRQTAESKEHPPKNRYDLTVGYSPFHLDGREGTATAINGSVPGPLVHLREGDDIIIRVTNNLMDSAHSSIHWHGIPVPYQMDGVPGVSFAGIKPGDTYEYSFPVQQAGTYWYHSHSRFQEQTGAYGPLIIDPKDGEPFEYDRDYPIVLSDWSFEDPETIYRKLNLMAITTTSSSSRCGIS